MADETAAPAASAAAPAPMTGGVTSQDTSPNVANDVFDTSGSEPVRDKTADPAKGQPVTRYFTKEGTPVEPSSIKPSGSAYEMSAPDPATRADVVAAVEYLDETGSPVTHDSLAAKEAEKA